MNRPLALLVAATFFMENLDATILVTAVPAIAADLRVPPVDVNLAITAYLLTIAACIPASGWLTGRFGARRVFLTAIAVFTAASLLCALSVTFPMLVGSRVLQGVGGALMVPVGRLVVLRVTEKRDLLDAVAYLTWPALLAPVFAPVLGGWITTIASWHWIFLINVPLGAAAFVAAWRLVRTEPDRPTPPPLDWFGFALCAGPWWRCSPRSNSSRRAVRTRSACWSAWPPRSGWGWPARDGSAGPPTRCSGSPR